MPGKGLANLTVKAETRELVQRFIEGKRSQLSHEVESLKAYTSIPEFVQSAVKEKIQREGGLPGDK